MAIRKVVIVSSWSVAKGKEARETQKKFDKLENLDKFTV